MITIAYSTRSRNKRHLKKIKKWCTTSNVEIIEYVNSDGVGLSTVYNGLIDKAKNDYVIFLHDDVKLQKGFDKIIYDIFDKTSYGILGVAGSPRLDETGVWWSNRKEMYGNVWHKNEFNEWHKLKYQGKFTKKIMPVVVIDGLFMAVNKSRIKSNFNESFDGFHYYDIPFCVDNYLKNVRIGVINLFDVFHDSIGLTSPQWESNRKKFVEAYKEVLPLNSNKNG